MASIIPSYEYDIFISYRQKDNKGDRWVSEFVEALKTELESTFKEEISVYFDINPHDRLLETHDVNASLKEKLKWLVFIPIISQTYCDPQSFAWQQELRKSSDTFVVIMTRGHPVLIDKKYRIELEKLDAGKGLRSLAYKFSDDILEINTDESGILRDFNIYEDYMKELNQIQ
jgi:hypothetical protein